MAKVDEVDMLRSQVLTLRQEALNRDKEAFAKALVAKYGKPGVTAVSIQPDGTIAFPKKT